MNQSRAAIWMLAVGASALLIALLFAVRADAFFPQADLRLLLALNGTRARGADVFLSALTDANTLVSVGAIAWVGVAAGARRSRRLAWKAGVLLATLLAGALLVYLLKIFVERPRPFAVDAMVEKLSGGGSPSFPSGHVTEAVAMLTAVALLFPKQRWITAALIFWSVFIAYSRMATGVHYPSDVLGGALAGIATGTIIHLCFRPRLKSVSDELR